MSHSNHSTLLRKYPEISQYIKDHGFQSFMDIIKTNRSLPYLKKIEEHIREFEELNQVHLLMYNDAKKLYNLSLELNNPPYLVRAFCKEVITVIEADLFNLNKMHPYAGYHHLDRFSDRVKKTLKFYANEKSSNNSSLKNRVESYLGSKFKDLHNLNKQRNAYTHPKCLSSLQEPFQIEEGFRVLEDYQSIYNSIFRSV